LKACDAAARDDIALQRPNVDIQITVDGKEIDEEIRGLIAKDLEKFKSKLGEKIRKLKY
jgi:hypothetical protein